MLEPILQRFSSYKTNLDQMSVDPARGKVGSLLRPCSLREAPGGRVTEGRMGSGEQMKDGFCEAGEAEKPVSPMAPFPPWATQTQLGSGRLPLQSIFKTTHL